MKAVSGSSLWRRPSTRAGQWAISLAAVFAVLLIINMFVFFPTSQNGTNPLWRQILLPIFGISMILCGLATGVLSVVAITKKHERSWLVWLTTLFGAYILFLLLGEFLFPH